MLSVMVPTKVCVFAACAADSAVSASAHTIKLRTTYSPGVIRCAVVVPAFIILPPRVHKVPRRGARVHDPPPAAPAVLRQTQRRLGGARHGYRHVRACHLLA